MKLLKTCRKLIQITENSLFKNKKKITEKTSLIDELEKDKQSKSSIIQTKLKDIENFKFTGVVSKAEIRNYKSEIALMHQAILDIEIEIKNIDKEIVDHKKEQDLLFIEQKKINKKIEKYKLLLKRAKSEKIMNDEMMEMDDLEEAISCRRK